MEELSLKSILLHYQREWLTDRAPVKVYEKSRRIGITWTESADAALNAARRGGTDWWYIGYNKEMALEFVEAGLARTLPAPWQSSYAGHPIRSRYRRALE